MSSEKFEFHSPSHALFEDAVNGRGVGKELTHVEIARGVDVARVIADTRDCKIGRLNKINLHFVVYGGPPTLGCPIQYVHVQLQISFQIVTDALATADL